MEDVRGALAANLAELRKEENLTQAEFAARFNYSDKAVSKWERGDSLPDVVMLKTIADGVAGMATTMSEKFGMNADDLAMIPIYCGVDGEEKAGLCAGTENCWAINNEASEEDIQATIDFLVWVVTSDEGTTMLAQEFGPCPFKDAKEPENVFFQDANKYTADGKYVVTWAFNWTPAVDDWRAAVVDALTQYSAGTGDWSAVETAFVQGWATQYAKENA